MRRFSSAPLVALSLFTALAVVGCPEPAAPDGGAAPAEDAGGDPPDPDGGRPGDLDGGRPGDPDGGTPGTDGGPGADGGAPGGDGGLSVPAPFFAGIAQVFADGTDRLSVTWIAAVDDVTPADQITYRLYRGYSEQEALAAADAGGAPALTVTGVTHAELTGLLPGEALYLVAVAVDEDGNESEGRRVVTGATSRTPVVVRQGVKDLAAMDVVVTELGYDRFSVSGPAAGGLVEGDIVLVGNSFGRSLRRIAALTGAPPSVEITTEKAALVDVFQSGELNASAVLLDPGVSANGLGGLSAAGRTHKRYRDPETGLVLEQRRVHAARLSPPTGPHALLLDELPEGVELTYEMSFEPEVKAEVKFSDSFVSKPERVKLTATGHFAVDGRAAYTVDGAVEYAAETELLSRKLTLTYVVGGVPVLQTVELALMAGVEMKAEHAFEASMDVHAEKTFTVGFEWDSANGFLPIREDGFEQTTELTLSGEAKAEATLKIYPVIKTSFYEALTGEVEVVPQVVLEAEARFVPLPIELTKADVTFLVDAQAKGDLTILGQEIGKWESDRIELYRVPIHSLPDVDLITTQSSANTCHPLSVFLRIQDGMNNAVLPENIGITVEPPGPVISFDAGRVRAEVTSMMPGTYTIKANAYGDGVLGPLGTRYSELEVTFDDPGVSCDQVPPPSSTGISCEGGVTGLTGPPSWTKNRYEMYSDDVPVLRAPFHALPSTMVYGFLKLEGVPRSYVPPGQDIYAGLWPVYGPPDADLDGVLELSPQFTQEGGLPSLPGRYAPEIAFTHYSGASTGCHGNMVNFECGGYSVDWVSTDPILFEGSYLINTSILGPEWDSPYDDVSCSSETGIPSPRIEVVGPRPPYDDNDTPALAEPLPQFVRVNEELRPGDVDFFRFEPQGDVFDTPQLPLDDPSCFVEVKAEAPPYVYPPPRITVYRGEAGAANDTDVVVQGYGRVVFRPIPTEVYFARMDAPDGTNVPSYTAEIDSDCTAQTQYPSLTGPLALSTATVQAGGTVTLTAPIDSLTAYAWFALRERDDETRGGLDVAATVDPQAMTAVATLTPDVYLAPGEYQVYVILRDADQALASRYLVDSSFSTTLYAVERQNELAGAQPVREETTIPAAFVTLE